MDSWNIITPPRRLSDYDKKSILKKAFKNQCRINAMYCYTPSISEFGIYERVRITWAQNYSDSDSYKNMILKAANFPTGFKVCTAEDAFAYYFGY